jgi:hypothetical protein
MRDLELYSDLKLFEATFGPDVTLLLQRNDVQKHRLGFIWRDYILQLANKRKAFAPLTSFPISEGLLKVIYNPLLQVIL